MHLLKNILIFNLVAMDEDMVAMVAMDEDTAVMGKQRYYSINQFLTLFCFTAAMVRKMLIKNFLNCDFFFLNKFKIII